MHADENRTISFVAFDSIRTDQVLSAFDKCLELSVSPWHVCYMWSVAKNRKDRAICPAFSCLYVDLDSGFFFGGFLCGWFLRRRLFGRGLLGDCFLSCLLGRRFFGNRLLLRCNQLFFPSALFLRASLYCAPALGGLDLSQRPGTLRTGFLLWWVPKSIFTFRVKVAGVEDLAVTALLLHHLAFFTLWAGDVERLWFLQRLNVLTRWIGAAGVELSITASFDQHASAALVAFFI